MRLLISRSISPACIGIAALAPYARPSSPRIFRPAPGAGWAARAAGSMRCYTETERHRRKALSKRNATAAVIGAGDFIGSAIAKKFAAEGFTIFAGRRNAEKLAPLVSAVETAGGEIVARGLDARKEEDVAAFMRAADAHAPPEVCVINIGATVSFPLHHTTQRESGRV